MSSKVIILGGGVAGMTAAHELAERGFEVELFERRGMPGGKARSMPKPRSGKGGRPALPGEHGFRFIPGYYRHLPCTLARIPCGSERGCPEGHHVADHLVSTTQMQVARVEDAPAQFTFAPIGPFKSDLLTAINFVFTYRSRLGIGSRDFALFVLRLMDVLKSPREAWFERFETTSWRDFTRMNAYDPDSPYRKYLARGLTRTMVAARAEEITTRTAVCTAVKLLQSLSREGGRADCVLDGPTSEVWIHPWREYLRQRGVKFRFRHEVKTINCSNGVITGVTVEGPGGQQREVRGRYYVCALPVEVMRDPLVSEGMREADRIFSTLHRLPVAWMNGVMFYLLNDVQQIHGHTIYVDSNWALTSISQQQFWRTRVDERGDGRARGILSVDVSDWKSGEWEDRIASRSSRAQIKEGVLDQLRDHLERAPLQEIDSRNVHSWFMDPAITYPNPNQVANAEPLLINKPNSYQFRPRVTTGIANLFVAGDYAQTDTDLACMEGANEAGRRAANAILERHGEGDLSRTWQWDPPFVKAARAVDAQIGTAARLARGVTPRWLRGQFEEHLSSRIGARVADLLALGEIAEPAPPAEELLTEREQTAFAEDLVYSPEDTLVEVEGRFPQSRDLLRERAREAIEK